MLIPCWLCMSGMVVPKFDLSAKATSGEEEKALVKSECFLGLHEPCTGSFCWLWILQYSPARAGVGMSELCKYCFFLSRVICSFLHRDRRAGGAWLPSCSQRSGDAEAPGLENNSCHIPKEALWKWEGYGGGGNAQQDTVSSYLPQPLQSGACWASHSSCL